MSKGIALLSAGLDSSVALVLFKEAGNELILVLTMDYGQRAAVPEVNFSKRICEYYRVPHRVIELPWFKEFESGLIDGKIPEPRSVDLSDEQITRDSARAVWVPNRNGVLIEIAAAFAERLGADNVVVGFNREESVTFPDNSTQYQTAITRALSYSTMNRVEVVSPTAKLNKRQIVT